MFFVLLLTGLLEDQPQHYDSAATLKAKTLYQSCINICKYMMFFDPFSALSILCKESSN